MCASMADIQSGTAEIRRGKKRKPQDENILVCPIRASIVIFLYIDAAVSHNSYEVETKRYYRPQWDPHTTLHYGSIFNDRE